MSGWFFDTSAFAKLYHPEKGTTRVESIINTPGQRVWISRLTVVELASAFAQKVRTGLLLPDDALGLVRRFREDLSSERFETYGILEEDFAQAESLIERHAFGLALRSQDAIQLAVAASLRGGGLIEYLVASDRVLCRVARWKASRLSIRRTSNFGIPNRRHLHG